MLGEGNVSTWVCSAMHVTESLPIIQEAGFGSVEVWGDSPTHFDVDNPDEVTRLRDDLAAFGLRADSLHAPFGEEMDWAQARW
jgi:hypothetical protein